MNAINLNVEVPHDNEEVIELFQTELNMRLNKYMCQPASEYLAMEIQSELEEFYSEHPEYNNILIRSNDYGATEFWSIDKLLEEHSETCPDIFEFKNEYTRMEINNMLFDLKLKNVIIGYRSPAVCADLPSHNNQIYTDDIEVVVPIINVGNKTEYQMTKNKTQNIFPESI